MQRSLLVSLGMAIALICAPVLGAPPASPGNGQLHQADGDYQAWSERSSQWLPVEAFWLEYAQHNGGHFWGQTTEYPVYEQVKEHDTLLIQLREGPCLMYFFHNRWRRAQDVRRWDPQFNEILGCPHVFD